MAVVHFYTHETLEKDQPTKGLWQWFRRWLVKKGSPKFGHCGIEFNGPESFDVTFAGYQRSGLGLRLSGDSQLEVAKAQKPHPDIYPESFRWGYIELWNELAERWD